MRLQDFFHSVFDTKFFLFQKRFFLKLLLTWILKGEEFANAGFATFVFPGEFSKFTVTGKQLSLERFHIY